MWKIALNIFALLVLGFALVYQMNYAPKDPSFDSKSLGIQGGDFSLATGAGDVKLSDFRGKALVLYFGFASCPDVCPMALSYLNGVLNKFEKRDEVQVLFVSVDYKRDTPDSVSQYASFFNKDFVGATGTKEQIDEAAKKYGVYYKFIEMEDSELGYTVDHTSRFFIIDKKGNLQRVVRSEEDPAVFRTQLTEVLEMDK